MVRKARQGTISFWELTLARLFPIIFSGGAFILISPWTAQYRWIAGNPTTVLYGWLFLYIGGVFVIEFFRALGPAVGGKSIGASYASVLFIGFFVACFAIGGAIISGFYQFTDGNVNEIISVLLILAIGMFLFHGREEIFHGRRAHEAFISKFG